jgi:hypothetical protein
MRSAIRFVGVFVDLSMIVLDPAARPRAVAGSGARHALQSMRDAERPRRGFHRGQRSHGLLGGSGAFRERHRIMVRRAVWFPPSSRRGDTHQQHDIHVPHGWIARLRSSIEAKQIFGSVAQLQQPKDDVITSSRLPCWRRAQPRRNTGSPVPHRAAGGRGATRLRRCARRAQCAQAQEAGWAAASPTATP